jgi:AbrB family looped-hinge helix DNA binding protein
MDTVKISPEFAIIIPQSIREALSLQPGEELHIFASGRTIRLQPMRERCAGEPTIRRLYGAAKGMEWKDCDRDRNDRF